MSHNIIYWKGLRPLVAAIAVVVATSTVAGAAVAAEITYDEEVVVVEVADAVSSPIPLGEETSREAEEVLASELEDLDLESLGISDLIDDTLILGEENVLFTWEGSIALGSEESPETTLVSHEGGESLSIQPVGTVEVLSGDSTTTYETSEGSTVVAHATSDGGVQLTSVIHEGQSSVSYEAVIPEGFSWVPQEDGSWSITSGDEEYGRLAAPWAVDATGRTLNTWYDFGEGLLTQYVDTTDAVFPIVADPSAVWWAATAAKCAASLALIANPAKVAVIGKSLASIALKSKTIAAIVTKLGGTSEAIKITFKVMIIKLKMKAGTASWGKLIPNYYVTNSQMERGARLLGFLGESFWEAAGFGSCASLGLALAGRIK